jgi:hypothetical protein
VDRNADVDLPPRTHILNPFGRQGKDISESEVGVVAALDGVVSAVVVEESGGKLTKESGRYQLADHGPSAVSHFSPI